jgi:archaellum component FlaC
MQFKTISYKRILNLGNYESKHLELSAEVHEEDDLDAEISRLMEEVERKIREDVTQKIELEIRELRKQIRELKKEELAIKSALEPQEEVSPDDIPFEADNTNSSSNPDDF